MKLRLLFDEEVEEVSEVHKRVVDLLLSKNIKQWMNPIPFKVFWDRQTRNENFGLFDEHGNFLAYACISQKEHPIEWEESLSEHWGAMYWLSSVFVNPDHKQTGLGEQLLEACFNFLKSRNVRTIFLDCVINEGFLVNYYKRFGFSLLDEKYVRYRSGEFKMALMKKNI